MSHIGEKNSFRQDLGFATGTGTLGLGGTATVSLTDANQFNIVITYAVGSSVGAGDSPLSLTSKSGTGFNVKGKASQPFEWVAIKT